MKRVGMQAKSRDAKSRGMLDARIVGDEVVILKDVHEGCWLAASRPDAAYFLSLSQLLACSLTSKAFPQRPVGFLGTVRHHNTATTRHCTSTSPARSCSGCHRG
ncbi:hypothetical protein GMOD_00004011 [Pyrenophora seminiperda CCB06]|uniref:Uncharacterized protein n=1 Tax=Pyrenophora seminiperda CCB06 TaxID=1302712 RepID=A0A3M7M0K5_9PLEO|nr:hypothetical protein GMOD_00004011 [Pyrenophora seminiperda CCB06]